MKKSLLFLVVCLSLSIATTANAADVLVLGNADFETAWTGLTPHGESILQKAGTFSDVTGWIGQPGDGSLTLYQGPGHAGGNAAVLSNPSSSANSRFGNNSVLTLTKGSLYKLTYYVRGNADMNVYLFNSAANPNGAAANGGNANAIYSSEQTGLAAVSYGATWTKVERTFSVSASSAFTDCKLYFAFLKTVLPAEDGNNLEEVLMIDDISIEPFVDNTIATLTGIKVGGKTISNFNANTESYSFMTNKTEIPEVTATSTDALATVNVKETQYSGNSATVEIEVTAADGTTKKTYTLTFTITNDLVVEGFGSDVLPDGWLTSQFMIDANANYNNGLYIGQNSIRIRAGEGEPVTEGWFMIPALDAPKTLSFYLRARDAATCTLSIYKRTASADTFDGLTGWTSCESYDTFDATFTEKTIDINAAESTDILFYVTKDNGKVPFAIDDIRITTDKSAGVNKTVSDNLKIGIAKGKVTLLTENSLSYSVKTVNGALVKSGRGNNVELYLPQGFYLLEAEGAVYKIVIP